MLCCVRCVCGRVLLCSVLFDACVCAPPILHLVIAFRIWQNMYAPPLPQRRGDRVCYSVHCLAFTPNLGKSGYVAAGCGDGSLRVWDMGTLHREGGGRLRTHLTLAAGSCVRGCACVCAWVCFRIVCLLGRRWIEDVRRRWLCLLPGNERTAFDCRTTD